MKDIGRPRGDAIGEIERERERDSFVQRKKKRDSPKWLVIGLNIDYSIVCFFFQLILLVTWRFDYEFINVSTPGGLGSNLRRRKLCRS